MLQWPKEQSHIGVLFGGEGVPPLAVAGVYPKTRVRVSEPENMPCFGATAPLKIELRWGCEESGKKTAVGSGVTFKYDPFGRRIEKSSSAGTSIYAYDGINVVEESNATGGAVARYTQTENVDEPLAMLRSSTTSYYEADGLGSITSLSSSGGSLAQTYGYDSFGKQTSSSGSITNPFQYTAREVDPETSLSFYRNRYLDVSTGRFLSEDPIAFLAGTNFYAYVHNEPVGWADPTGEQKCKKSCGVKKGPEYGPSGTIRGGTSFAFGAEFLNDSDHSPSCCEVRQFILRNQALKDSLGVPHQGFSSNSEPYNWYEDRDQWDQRFRRPGRPHSPGNLSGVNDYHGNGFDGRDTPSGYPPGVTFLFHLTVVDICNGGKTVYTSRTLTDNF